MVAEVAIAALGSHCWPASRTGAGALVYAAG
jgi:hypothetical protein